MNEIVLACVPWAWRNYTALGEIMFVRSNLGLELRLAHHDGTAAAFGTTLEREGDDLLHPHVHVQEATQIQVLGEAEYMRRAKAEALTWMKTHPGDTLVLTLQRVALFWLGPFRTPPLALIVTGLTLLALVGGRSAWPDLAVPQRAALLIPLAIYPLVYYLVSFVFRYRIPIHWMILALAGAAVWRWMAPSSLTGQR